MPYLQGLLPWDEMGFLVLRRVVFPHLKPGFLSTVGPRYRNRVGTARPYSYHPMILLTRSILIARFGCTILFYFIKKR